MAKNKVYFVASSFPVKFILEEITGDSNTIYCPMKPGTSVHTFSPRPSDISMFRNSKAIFYISDNLDYWIKNFEHPSKIELIRFIKSEDIVYFNHPEHETLSKESTSIDPHFWTDPMIIKSLAPELLKTLIKINPVDSAKYRYNSLLFIDKLTALDNEFRKALEPYNSRYVLLFHPSFLYLLKRYKLNYAGSIEESPGKEPTARYINEIRKKTAEFGIKTLYSEPQLSEKALQPIADGTTLKIMTLDPIGGIKGRNNYFELMRFNVMNLVKGFN